MKRTDLKKAIFLNESFVWTNGMIHKIRSNRDIIDKIITGDTKSLRWFFNGHDIKFRNFISSRSSVNWNEIDRQITEMVSGGITPLSLFDGDYPDQLKSIPDPPLVLYHVGSLFNFKNCIAISGTRRPSNRIRELTEEIARGLTKRGYTVTSGLAEGVDTAAHEGALSIEKGTTVAVMANGLKRVFPRKNLGLAVRISERGAVLSEKLLRPDPTRFDFIRRNRIISGISKVLIIMQSTGKGGTKHQFDLARAQGRPIMVLNEEGVPHESRKSHSSMISAGAEGFSSIEEALLMVDNIVGRLESHSRRKNIPIEMWA